MLDRAAAETMTGTGVNLAALAGLLPAPAVGWDRYLAALVLVLVRVGGLMTFAPLFSSKAVSLPAKALFAAVTAYMLAPVVAGLPLAHAELGVAPVLGELAVGLIFGLVLSLIAEALEFAGSLAGVQFSFSLVNLLDPNSSIETPLISQIFSLLFVLTVCAAGLDRTLLAALMRSFATAPLGSVVFQAAASAHAGHVGWTIFTLGSGVFACGMQLAAPVIAATMLVEVTTGLLGRLSPSLPVMVVSIPLKTMTGYVVLLGSLALWPRFIEARWSSLLDMAQRLVAHR